jgi:hypothetical protein
MREAFSAISSWNTGRGVKNQREAAFISLPTWRECSVEYRNRVAPKSSVSTQQIVRKRYPKKMDRQEIRTYLKTGGRRPMGHFPFAIRRTAITNLEQAIETVKQLGARKFPHDQRVHAVPGAQRDIINVSNKPSGRASDAWKRTKPACRCRKVRSTTHATRLYLLNRRPKVTKLFDATYMSGTDHLRPDRRPVIRYEHG